MALVEVDARIRRAFARFAIIHRRSECEWLVTSIATPVEQVRSALDSVAGGQLVPVNGAQCYISVVAGLVTDSSSDVRNESDSMIREADAALSTAINDGLSVVVGDQTKVDGIVARKGLATRIAQAVDTDFQPFYQPIVSLPDRRLVGQEMVLRWRTRDDEWELPNNFMSVANDTGRILTIGSRIISDAISEHLSTWGSSETMPFLSVNLSRPQMLDPGIVDQISAALARNGMPADKLWIEVSETQIIDLRGQALTTLEELRRRGCIICIDDLGVGYSALSYLWELPVGVVKLDRSLIRGMAGADQSRLAFMRGICQLAATAGVSVVAEGVEDASVLPLLVDLGVGYAQGFYFGAPAPVGEVTQSTALAVGDQPLR